jgi:predicted transcriptional regulator
LNWNRNSTKIYLQLQHADLIDVLANIVGASSAAILIIKQSVRKVNKIKLKSLALVRLLLKLFLLFQQVIFTCHNSQCNKENNGIRENQNLYFKIF